MTPEPTEPEQKTYRTRIENIISELEDIENTIPTDRHTYYLEQAIRALLIIVQ